VKPMPSAPARFSQSAGKDRRFVRTRVNLEFEDHIVPPGWREHETEPVRIRRLTDRDELDTARVSVGRSDRAPKGAPTLRAVLEL
jgi:hypothetical protein